MPSQRRDERTPTNFECSTFRLVWSYKIHLIILFVIVFHILHSAAYRLHIFSMECLGFLGHMTVWRVAIGVQQSQEELIKLLNRMNYEKFFILPFFGFWATFVVFFSQGIKCQKIKKKYTLNSQENKNLLLELILHAWATLIFFYWIWLI